MILLDGLDKHSDPQRSKLVAESSVPVARVHTPTPSLPDYEASQAQLKPTTLSYPEIKEKRTRRRRWRKCALYSLVVYFVLTIAIGVPLMVVVCLSSSFFLSPLINRRPSQETKAEIICESESIRCLEWKSSNTTEIHYIGRCSFTTIVRQVM